MIVWYTRKISQRVRRFLNIWSLGDKLLTHFITLELEMRQWSWNLELMVCIRLVTMFSTSKHTTSNSLANWTLQMQCEDVVSRGLKLLTTRTIKCFRRGASSSNLMKWSFWRLLSIPLCHISKIFQNFNFSLHLQSHRYRISTWQQGMYFYNFLKYWYCN